MAEAETGGGAGSFTRKRTIYAWSFLAPTLLVVAFVALYPLAQTIYLSFTNTRFGDAEPARFIGVQNYADLAADGFFRDAVGNTVLFTVITVLIELVLGLMRPASPAPRMATPSRGRTTRRRTAGRPAGSP